MALKDILNSIEERLQQELDKIEDEEKKTTEEIKKKMKEEEKKTLNELTEQKKQKLHDMKQKMETIFKMESRNLTLEAKTKLINQVFEGAINTLRELPEKEYKKWLVSQLKSIPFDSGEIIPAKGREKITQEAMKECKLNFKLASAGDFSGGFIAQSEDMEINNMFESIVYKQLKSNLELKVAKILFS